MDLSFYGLEFMITTKREIPLLSKKDQVTLVDNVSKNPRHKLMVLLMLDCGLRVTELVTLRIENFDFRNHTLSVASLKKKSDKPIYREIPLTPRVIEALSEVYICLSDKSEKAYLFPTNSADGHISRKNVWKMIKRKSNWSAYPHVLRHTFASALINEGVDIHTTQDLLGHASYKTTEIYAHVFENKKVQAINRIDRRSRFKRLKDKLFPKQNVFVLNTTTHFDKVHVGRKKELKEINELFHKRVNVILIGPQGIGKSQLIKMLQHDKLLRLDDFKAVKSTIGNLLLELHQGDKEKVIDMITQQADIDKVVTKNSVPNLINLLIKCTQPNEYTLLIDDLTHITSAGVAALDKLKNHFHIICAARQVKMTQASFLSNFQKVEIDPLNRIESTKLIINLSKPLLNRIENIESYKNHIYDQTSGNPLFIRELVERFSKESVISIDHVREIRHTAALNEIDMSVPLVIGLSSLMVLRYIGGEFEDDTGAYRLFGGIFLLFALFARSIFNYGKRKFV